MTLTVFIVESVTYVAVCVALMWAHWRLWKELDRVSCERRAFLRILEARGDVTYRWTDPKTFHVRLDVDENEPVN